MPTPNPEPTGLWVSPEQFRNPDAVALKPEHVRQIVKPMSGYASVWVPPAGLYIENSKKGLGINMWELRDGKKEPVEDEWVQPPAVRGECLAKGSGVPQGTQGAVASVSTGRPFSASKVRAES